MSHIFKYRCVDWEEILSQPTLNKMLKTAHKQSKRLDAKQAVDFVNADRYEISEECPVYFGMFVEWFAEIYLNYYGDRYNVHNVKMADAEEEFVEDYGIDGEALSIYEQDIAAGREAKPNAPVYIQVKGTLNSKKIYYANDGSRITNFGTTAMIRAVAERRAYQTRLILFTTGAGVYYTLKDKMFAGFLEVIAYQDIKPRVDNNLIFLNHMRESVGLSPLPYVLPEKDDEEIEENT